MKNIIIGSIQAALNAALSRPNNSPRFKMTDARIDTLRKIHGSDVAFLDIAHKYYGATNYRSQAKYMRAMRAYVPEALAAKWAERDARKAEPIVNGVRFNPRTPRTPFNTIRVPF